MSDRALCEHGCREGEPCRATPCPALISIRPDWQQEVTRDGVTLLRWQWEMVDEYRQTDLRCPYGDHPVVRRGTRYKPGLWCPTCRSWLAPAEAHEAVKKARTRP